MVQVKTMEKENTNSLQVGAGPVKLKNVNKPLFGHYEKVHVEPKRFLTEFKVSEDAFLPVGTLRSERGRAQVSTTQACGIEVYSADRFGFLTQSHDCEWEWAIRSFLSSRSPVESIDLLRRNHTLTSPRHGTHLSPLRSRTAREHPGRHAGQGVPGRHAALGLPWSGCFAWCERFPSFVGIDGSASGSGWRCVRRRTLERRSRGRRCPDTWETSIARCRTCW